MPLAEKDLMFLSLCKLALLPATLLLLLLPPCLPPSQKASAAEKELEGLHHQQTEKLTSMAQEKVAPAN